MLVQSVTSTPSRSSISEEIDPETLDSRRWVKKRLGLRGGFLQGREMGREGWGLDYRGGNWALFKKYLIRLFKIKLNPYQEGPRALSRASTFQPSAHRLILKKNIKKRSIFFFGFFWFFNFFLVFLKDPWDLFFKNPKDHLKKCPTRDQSRQLRQAFSGPVSRAKASHRVRQSASEGGSSKKIRRKLRMIFEAPSAGPPALYSA